MTQRLKIGELARRTGVSVDTIRHYERVGLLPQTARSTGGYRLFPPSTEQGVLLIRHAVALGFSLAQLKGFLRVRQAGGAVFRRTSHLSTNSRGVEQQIADLTQSRDALRALLGDWDDRLAGTPSGRPAHLLEALAASPERTRRRPVGNLRRPGLRRA
jgi:DNA-binding transcriptional MerR regulator